LTGILEAGEQTAFPFDRRVDCQLNDFSLAGQHLTVRTPQNSYENLFLPLLGRHQIKNAAAAVAVTEILAEKGAVISREAVYRGMANTFWPARLEVFPGEPTAAVDGAHNYAGAKALRRAWDDYFPGRGIILVLGMLGDKEWARVVGELAPRARAVVVTKPDSPRAQDWQNIAAEARRYVREVHAVEAVSGAVAKALSIARPDEVVCVTGSLYMAAEAREALCSRFDRGIKDAV